MFARYRDGASVTVLAGDLGVTFDWVAQQIIAANVRRDVPARAAPRRSRRPELDDAAWLRRELAAQAGVRGISRQLAVRASIVRAALRRHGITEPDDVRRHPAERSNPTERFQAGISRVLRARCEIERAMSLQASAIAELQHDGLTIAAIADRFEVDTVVIERLLDPPAGELAEDHDAIDRTDTPPCPCCGRPWSAT